MSNVNPANANAVGQVPRTEFLRPDGKLTREAQAFLRQLSTEVLAGTAQSSSCTSGSASALPSAPAGYLEITLNGVAVKIPYYNP